MICCPKRAASRSASKRATVSTPWHLTTLLNDKTLPLDDLIARYVGGEAIDGDDDDDDGFDDGEAAAAAASDAYFDAPEE